VVTTDEKMQGNMDGYANLISSTDLINNGQATVASVAVTRYSAYLPDNAKQPGSPDYVLSDGSNTNHAFSLNSDWSVTYNLNAALSPKGYSLRTIDLFSAWGDNRAGITCDVYVSSVSSPDVWQLVASLDSAGPGGSLQSHHVQLAGASHPLPFFSGAAAVRFDLKATGGNTNGWREIDVAGAITGAISLRASERANPLCLPVSRTLTHKQGQGDFPSVCAPFPAG